MNTKNRNKIIITPEEAGERLDSLLCTLYPGLSRSRIQKEIKNGCILVNKAAAKPSKILKIEDEIDISIEEPAKIEILPENLLLKILYEDEKCAVILKPKNMLTHPTAKETSGTLVNALLYHFKTLSDCNGEFRPGIVHRLDRNTSGLLLIAKTNDSYENLKLQMQNRTIEKRYYAVVSGNFENEEGTISTNLGRHPSKPEKMAVCADGKPAITHYSVAERFKGYTLLDIKLETGRTHQIRVHMAHIGHPIVNDSFYGGAKIPVKTTEQALQAYSLTFVSPADGQERTISTDFDDDIIKVLNYLRSTK